MCKSGAVKALFVALLMTAAGAQAAEQPPIRVGEISSYSALPVGTRGYRQGWELARDEITAGGGVLARKLETIATHPTRKPHLSITHTTHLSPPAPLNL